MSPYYCAGLGIKTYINALGILSILEREVNFEATNTSFIKSSPIFYFLISLLVLYILARLFATVIVGTHPSITKEQSYIDTLQKTIDNLSKDKETYRTKYLATQESESLLKDQMDSLVKQYAGFISNQTIKSLENTIDRLEKELTELKKKIVTPPENNDGPLPVDHLSENDQIV